MTRNLLYHVTPMGNWKWNVAELCKRIELFNGVRLIAIAEERGFPPAAEVLKEFGEHRKELSFIVVANDKQLRETASFGRLVAELENKIRSANLKPGITFYGHTKGVSRGNDPTIKLWTEGCYHYTLDFIDEIERQMTWYACTGPFKRYDPPDARDLFPAGGHRWHYSGSFFWFNTETVLKEDWREALKPSRYGVEAWLSFMFAPSEAGCTFGDGVGRMDTPAVTEALLGKSKEKREEAPPKKVSVVVTCHYVDGVAPELHGMLVCLQNQKEYKAAISPRTGKRYVYAAGPFTTLPTEVILAVDGSFPGTRNGLVYHEVVACPKEGGVGHHTREPGMKKATGDWIVLTNMDNYFSPAWRYRLEEYIQEETAGLVYWNGVNNLWRCGTRTSKIKRGEIDLSFAAVRKDIALAVGFPFRNYTGDFDYLQACARLCRKKRLEILHIDEILSIHS